MRHRDLLRLLIIKGIHPKQHIAQRFNKTKAKMDRVVDVIGEAL